MLLGSGIENLADQLGPYGADKVYYLEDETFKNYLNESYTQGISELVKSQNPSILLGGATALGKDLFPRVATRLGTGLAMDCVSIDFGDNGF